MSDQPQTETGPMKLPVEPFTTTRYRCPHCRKSYANKAPAQKHANECHHAPDTKSCGTCVHFQKPCCFSPNDQCGCRGQATCDMLNSDFEDNGNHWIKHCNDHQRKQQ